MDLAARIPPCFNEVGQMFAGTPDEQDCAFDLLIDSRDSGVGWSQMEGALREFLLSKSLDPHAVEIEIGEAREAFEYWLK